MEIFQATPVNIEEGNHFSKQKLEEIITSTEIIHNFFQAQGYHQPTVKYKQYTYKSMSSLIRYISTLVTIEKENTGNSAAQIKSI